MKLTQEQAEAVVRLIGFPEFRVFMELLGAEGEKAMHQYINATSGRKTKQGKCQAFTEIVDAIATAKSTHDSYQNSK